MDTGIPDDAAGLEKLIRRRIIRAKTFIQRRNRQRLMLAINYCERFLDTNYCDRRTEARLENLIAEARRIVEELPEWPVNGHQPKRHGGN